MGKNDEFELKFLLEEIAKIECQMRILNDKDDLETQFIKKQVFELQNDKFKLEQNTMLLEERVKRTNKQIGFYVN